VHAPRRAACSPRAEAVASSVPAFASYLGASVPSPFPQLSRAPDITATSPAGRSHRRWPCRRRPRRRQGRRASRRFLLSGSKVLSTSSVACPHNPRCQSRSEGDSATARGGPRTRRSRAARSSAWSSARPDHRVTEPAPPRKPQPGHGCRIGRGRERRSRRIQEGPGAAARPHHHRPLHVGDERLGGDPGAARR
jgi:hypothetical protein